MTRRSPTAAFDRRRYDRRLISGAAFGDDAELPSRAGDARSGLDATPRLSP